MKERLKNAVRRIVVPTGFYFSQPGRCPCCDRQVVFTALNSWLRDSFRCPVCKSVPRERALMSTIETQYPNWRNLKIHESSPINRGASVKLKTQGKQYTASQFYPTKPFGSIVDGFVNQDLEAQTFADASFDLVITQEVFEHIYEPAKAFAEIARTLKPGGAHLFTVPLINKHKKTEVWATRNPDGSPKFLHAPEWHGNPVDTGGSPVTMHWGFDIKDFIEKTSSLQTEIVHLDDLSRGIRAEYIEVLVSKKAGF